MSVDFISKCRYVASPFTNLKDLSLRLLVRKYGAQLCYTPLVNLSDLPQKDWLWRKLFHHFNQDEDRPLVFQLCSKESDSLVKVVSTLEGYCDAVDISHQNFNAGHWLLGNEEDNWNTLLHLIERVHNECNAAIVCKLPFNQYTIAETIKKGNMLQEHGCQLLLLHRCTKERINSIVTKKDWDAIKTIRESLSLPLILDVGSSSLWEVDKCLEYTGVQGIAVSDSLESNPAFFCKKQPLVSKVVEQYLDLCKIHPAPLSNIKSHLSKFCGHYLSRFHNIETNMVDIETFEDICRLVDQLNAEISLLSKKEMKSLVRLKEKKEYFKRVNGIKQKEKRSLRQNGLQSGKLKKDENHIPKVVVKKSQRERVENALNGNGQKIAIDFTPSEDMSNKEVSKLAAQVRRLYGSNMRSINPVHLYFTGLSTSSRVYSECIRQTVGFDHFLVDMSEKSFHVLFDRDDVVYLTPDSPYVLDKLNQDKIYIIGGLVDHQMRKEVTLSRSETADVRTARLPIDECMERTKEPGNYSFSKVLTVNQVFDILLTFHETHNWHWALAAGIPPRKGLVLKE